MQPKNQISKLRKTLYGIMLLSVFVSAFGVGDLSIANAQEETLYEPKQTVENYFPTFEESIEAGLKEYEDNTDHAFALRITASTTDDTYGYAKVQPDWEGIVVEEQEEFEFIILAENTENGWYAVAPELVSNETYNNLLLHLSNDLR